MKKIILPMMLFLCLSSGGFAGEFGLESVSVSDLKGSAGAALAAVPVPDGPYAVMSKGTSMELALDMSVKIPFSEINKRMVNFVAMMKVLDQSKPVFSRRGKNIVFTNVGISYKGLDAEPTVLLDPSFEGNNRLAIRFPQVDANIVFGPKVLGATNKDDLIAAIADSLTASMLESMDEALAANKVQLKAKDVLSFTYDKASWTLRAAVSPDFVTPLLPGLVSNVNLTAFSFDDKGFTLAVRSGPGAAMGRMAGYNLALSDGLVTDFLRKCAEGGDYDLNPKGYDGGIKFRADGRVVVSLRATFRDMLLKPDVYAAIEFLPTLVSPNTVTLRFEKVTLDQAYGLSIPGSVSNMLQSRVLAVILNGIMTNKNLAQTMSARKVDERTVEFKLKNSAFMPSFAKGVLINKIKIERGLMFLGFEF